MCYYNNTIVDISYYNLGNFCVCVCVSVLLYVSTFHNGSSPIWIEDRGCSRTAGNDYFNTNYDILTISDNE
jgi:hypothetical protein